MLPPLTFTGSWDGIQTLVFTNYAISLALLPSRIIKRYHASTIHSLEDFEVGLSSGSWAHALYKALVLSRSLS